MAAVIGGCVTLGVNNAENVGGGVGLALAHFDPMQARIDGHDYVVSHLTLHANVLSRSYE